jgi:hypothetical protein
LPRFSNPFRTQFGLRLVVVRPSGTVLERLLTSHARPDLFWEFAHAELIGNLALAYFEAAGP